MGRLLRFITVGMLVLGAATLALGRAGVGRFQCACASNCWCKKPGLSLFRWITPGEWHSIPHHA